MLVRSDKLSGMTEATLSDPVPLNSHTWVRCCIDVLGMVDCGLSFAVRGVSIEPDTGQVSDFDTSGI